MIARILVAASLATAVAAGAQQAAPPTPPPPPGPVVGDMAPDFMGPGADMKGTIKSPIKLADFKGQTVVLAFFPAARTTGCTLEMNQFRDQYATLFNGGKNVVVLGISTDADTTLASWAKEASFPFRFVSDADKAIGMKYGTITETRKTESRFVYVIAPDGKIAYTNKRFSPGTPPQYDSLGVEIKRASGTK